MKRRRDSKVESVKLVVSPERDLKLKCKRREIKLSIQYFLWCGNELQVVLVVTYMVLQEVRIIDWINDNNNKLVQLLKYDIYHLIFYWATFWHKKKIYLDGLKYIGKKCSNKYICLTLNEFIPSTCWSTLLKLLTLDFTLNNTRD